MSSPPHSSSPDSASVLDSLADIDKIWNSAHGLHSSSVVVIYGLLSQLVSFVGAERRLHLFKRISSTSLSAYDSNIINMIKEVTIHARAADDRDGQNDTESSTRRPSWSFTASVRRPSLAENAPLTEVANDYGVSLL